jgi:uncharacterized Rossmann fold enzyme
MEALRCDYRTTEASLPPPLDPRENILSSLTRGLPEFQPGLFPHDGTMVVCGSGPSLPSFLDDIRAEREKRRPIIAVKGAHDLLCEHGIEPNVFISCEARPRLENIQRKNPNTLYLLSGRCAPEVFDWLSDCNVMLFHTFAPQEGEMPELKGKQLIGGGTTSGLRAVTVGYLMGFSKFVLYGFDSCLAADKRKRFDSAAMKPHQIITRILRGRRFLCNAAMAMQADEFQEYYKMLPGVSFDVKGDGLLAAICAERTRLGMNV